MKGKKEKKIEEKRKGYLISIKPSVKNKAHSKAMTQGKQFNALVEQLLYDFSAE